MTTPDIEPRDSLTDPVHLWFGLSHASWLVWPRAVMQRMPVGWQERFVALADEMGERASNWSDGIDLNVSVKSGGKFIPMPNKFNYRRGHIYVKR